MWFAFGFNHPCGSGVPPARGWYCGHAFPASELAGRAGPPLRRDCGGRKMQRERTGKESAAQISTLWSSCACTVTTLAAPPFVIFEGWAFLRLTPYFRMRIGPAAAPVVVNELQRTELRIRKVSWYRQQKCPPFEHREGWGNQPVMALQTQRWANDTHGLRRGLHSFAALRL